MAKGDKDKPKPAPHEPGKDGMGPSGQPWDRDPNDKPADE